jgi:hypothetical protein
LAIRAAVNLQLVHSLRYGDIWMAKHTANAAHMLWLVASFLKECSILV